MQTLLNAGNSQELGIPKSENVQVETISKVDIAWLAGVLDGEGYFILYYLNNKTRIGVNIGVTNSDARMLKKVSEIYSMYNLTYYYSLKTGNRKFAMDIKVAGFRSARKLINLVLPYLVNKQDQAMVLLEYLNYRISLYGSNDDLDRLPNGQLKSNGKQVYGEKDHYYWQKMRDLKTPPINLQRLQRKARHPLSWRDDIV
jgi:hypothetical protein